MSNPPIKYIHTVETHNTRAAEVIVPHIINLLHPKSVVDVGCGLGTFAYVFSRHGATDVLGIDGDWVTRELLLLEPSSFMTADLEQPLQANRKFDLAVCLEVVEHLRPEAAGTIVRSLTQLSDVVLFSAAIPMQGGQNHINEQWPAYWEKLFATQGFRFCDVLRPKFWDNENIEWWYRQNMFLVVRNGILPELGGDAATPRIHPGLLAQVIEQRDYNTARSARLDQWTDGKAPLKNYFTLLLKAGKARLGF